jgi:hypothetical protein
MTALVNKPTLRHFPTNGKPDFPVFAGPAPDVPQISNPQTLKQVPHAGGFRGPADWQSAIPPVGNLRYGHPA